MTVALAVVAGDPRDELLGKVAALLPALAELYDGIGVFASCDATDEALDVFRAHGAIVEREDLPSGVDTIGRRRRGTPALREPPLVRERDQRA